MVGKQREAAKAVHNTLTYGLGLGVFLLCIAGFSAGLQLPFLGPMNRGYWLLLAGLILLSVVQKAGQGILLGEDRIKLYSLVPVLFIVAYLGGNVLVLKVWDLGLPGVLEVWLVAVGIAALVAFVPLLIRASGFSGIDREVFRKILQVGGRGAGSTILIFLLFRANFYLVQYFMGEASVGVYKIATIFADMMQRLPNIAGLVLLPKVIRGQDEDDALSLNVARGVLLFSLLAAAGILVFGREVIDLFFGEYPDAYAPLVWMLPGLVLTGFGSVFNIKLAGQGYPAITLWAPAVALGVNVGLSWVLIPAMGLRGAALSTSVAYGLWVLAVTVFYRRRTGLSWGAFLRLRPFEPTIKKSNS